MKTEDQEKANILNDFFSSVFTVEGNSELPDFEQKVKDEDCINQIEITAVKVMKQLKSLNVSKSCGPDNCHPFFLNECADKIYLPLNDIFHKSLSSCVIPYDWKTANITCIFKKGNNQDLGNCRPVSLSSVICKLLERTVREEIVNHLSVNKLLSDSQFGFRKNRSTILQLLTVMNEWTEALDDGIQIDTLYLDFCKAFDSVSHKRLIKKLEGYNIKEILLEWFKNFLNGRQQRVEINGKTCDWTNVLSGIPRDQYLDLYYSLYSLMISQE